MQVIELVLFLALISCTGPQPSECHTVLSSNQLQQFHQWSVAGSLSLAEVDLAQQSSAAAADCIAATVSPGLLAAVTWT
jgi:hypothetical protein